MATTPSIEAPATAAAQPSPSRTAGLLVCLPSLPGDTLGAVLEHLQAAADGEPLLVAGASAQAAAPGIEVVEYGANRSQVGWVLAAADYTAAAATLAHHQGVSAVLLLSADASTLPVATLRALVEAVRSGTDLAVPRYPVGPNDALVSSALLYPLSRALFTTDVRFPLPVDAALSPRLLTRLASAAGRMPSGGGAEALVWPVSEAAVGAMSVRQVDTAERTLPSPPDTDLNTLLASVAGSLFADVESKAAFWQRGRAVAPLRQPTGQTPDQSSPPAANLPETAELIENFRLASANLTELWTLVLPPQTLVALKKLARQPAGQFALEPGIWARIVYDFALAFRLRTLNRSHLMGAMTPLYLAWVASHIEAAGDDATRAARLTEATAQAFEREKPYFVSRWRWPDRFNP